MPPMRAVPLVLALLLAACGGEPATSDIATAPLAEGAEATGSAPVLSDGSSADLESGIDLSLDAGDTPYVGMWAGEAPVAADGTRFVGVPTVRPRLEEAFGVEPGLLDRLLADPPLYRAAPIEAVGSMLGVTFEPTAANPDDRTLHLLVADDAGHVFALLTAPDGDTFYRASYDASAAVLPAEASAWMSRKAGVDFAAMVRTDDETELGP